MAGLFEELFSSGAELIGNNQLQNRLTGLGENVRAETGQLAETARQETQFKPFTVTTSGLGNVNTDAQGGLNLNLSPAQQQMQDRLLSQSGGFFDQAAQGSGAREQDIFDRIRATQLGEEGRNATTLENRLLGQGRLGVRTAQFGGTPEQLAQEKAVAEARNTASLSAIQQAQTEQAQNAQLGQQFQQSGFAPQQNLLSAFTPALGTAELAGIGQREGANLGAQLGLGGVTAQTNFEKLVADLARQQASTVGNLAGSVGQGIDASRATNSAVDTAIDGLFSLGGGLF